MMTNSTFDEFWDAWPKGHKHEKVKCEDIYWRARSGRLKIRGKKVPETDHTTIMEGLERYKRCKPDWQAWKHPKTWLGNACWMDEWAEQPAAPDPMAPKPCPQYLRRRDDKPSESADARKRKKLKLEAHEVLRARGLEPLWAPDEIIEQVMRELSQTDRRRTG